MTGRGDRGFRIFLTVVAWVMLVAGSGSVLLGAASVLGAGDFSAPIDSEMRFYAVWYVVSGVILLRAAKDPPRETWTIRLLAAGFFVAGCARALSWLVVGRPHASQLTLLAIELLLPFILIPWQRSIAHGAKIYPRRGSNTSELR